MTTLYENNPAFHIQVPLPHDSVQLLRPHPRDVASLATRKATTPRRAFASSRNLSAWLLLSVMCPVSIPHQGHLGTMFPSPIKCHPETELPALKGWLTPWHWWLQVWRLASIFVAQISHILTPRAAPVPRGHSWWRLNSIKAQTTFHKMRLWQVCLCRLTQVWSQYTTAKF